jgi:hypothetical protein
LDPAVDDSDEEEEGGADEGEDEVVEDNAECVPVGF